MLRRIPNAPDYFKGSLADPITPQAFRPNKNDTDGISLYRELFTSAEELAATGKNGDCYVARIAVADLIELGLAVVPSVVRNGLLGHVLIPEMNSQLKGDARLRCKDLQVELARLAGRDIVYRPR